MLALAAGLARRLRAAAGTAARPSLPLPFLVWAALRFDVRVVAWELAGFSLLTTALTVRGYGPFAVSTPPAPSRPAQVGALSQGYLLCAALMSLPLAIAVVQRRDLLRRVSGSELLFRRNFTESLVGMLLMRREGGRLEIFDLNDTAARRPRRGPAAAARAARSTRSSRPRSRSTTTSAPHARRHSSTAGGRRSA